MKSTNKERPIIFSGEMVRAILDGRKTMTRRVVTPQPIKQHHMSMCERGSYGALNTGSIAGRAEVLTNHAATVSSVQCPYGVPGDRLTPIVLITGFQDKYAASSDGNIYSKARGQWRQLKPWKNSKKYLVVTLMGSGAKLTRTVHRLVCEAFYGPPPSASHQVRHLDGDAKNNAAWNLAWGTQEENWLDRIAHGKGMDGEKHHQAKFSDTERSHIRWAVQGGLCSQRHAARVLGVSQSSIGMIVNGVEGVEVQPPIPKYRVPLITLEVTDVRVERVQEISNSDCRAEGCGPIYKTLAKHRFANTWDSINAKRNDGAYAWDKNPWVWVVGLRKVED